MTEEHSDGDLQHGGVEIEPTSDVDSAQGDDYDYGSTTSSILSSIRRGVAEHGRIYALYGDEEYGLPIDELELDRIDLKHAMYTMLLDEKLFLAPIDANPQRVLDLGTGTGIWAIDFAERYPSAEVHGVDIAPTQPEWVPPNCQFEIDDVEKDWLFKSSFDFIHARDFLLSIRDWPKLVSQCFDHVKPGGYVELQSIYPLARCDDGSTPPENGVLQYGQLAIQASAGMGTPLDDCVRYAEYLRTAGFTDIVEQRFKQPSGPWPKNRRLKIIGAYETQNLLQGISAFSYRMFQKSMGWTRDQTEAYLTTFRRDLKDLKCHTYYEFVVVYGRKPL